MAEHVADEMTQKEESVSSIIGSFLKAYKTRATAETDREWLDRQFGKYPEIWKSDDERQATACEVVDAVERFQKTHAQLHKEVSEGHSHERFLQRTFETACSGGAAAEVGRYATTIDRAIGEANENMANRLFVRHPDGTTTINQNPNLDGLIAETDHVNDFNIDAAANESSLHAEALESNGSNSVDIVIKDGNQKILRRYQSKYGADAERTDGLFKDGDYRGQRKLVPEGQTDGVPGSTDRIEADGVQSKPHSKAEEKAKQEAAQKDGKIPEYDWGNVGARALCKSIARKSMAAGALAVAFQGTRILARRAWNALTGQKNKSASEDLKEFAESAVKSGAGAAGTVALTGGVVVAVKKGLVGAALKSVRSNVIANTVCAAVENVKIISKLGKGEITGKQALDMAGSTNCAMVGSIALGTKGAAIGATVGSALGPVGTCIGGVVGGVVGAAAGSVVGQAAYEGAKKAVSVVCETVKKTWNGLKNKVKNFFDLFS